VAEVGPYIPHWMSDTRSPKALRPALSLGYTASALGSMSFGLKGEMWPPFPPNDLLQCLVNIYFSRVNVVWPLLHRPTFEADLMREHHRRDLGFASVVLAVCAVASRYCQDRRVLAKVRSTQDLPSARSDTTPMHPWDGTHLWTDDLDQEFSKGPVFNDAPLYSAGWKYFNRMQRCQVATADKLSLCELQTTHVSK
jgi:Fungal specific transcription factor domain